MGRARRLTERVTLDDPVDDGTPVTFSPASVSAELVPTSSAESVCTWQVTIRAHPQVTFNTRITWTDRNALVHRLFVRGVGNPGDVDRSGYMTLECDEVLTP